MGCTPSQSSNCIIVGQCNTSPSVEDNRKSTPKESRICNSAFEKKYYLEEDTDSQNEEYLQVHLIINLFAIFNHFQQCITTLIYIIQSNNS